MTTFLRGFRSVSLALVVGACATPSLTLEERQAVAGEVVAALTDLTEAMNAHDADRVVAFYTDAPEFVLLACTSAITGGARFKQMVGPVYQRELERTFQARVLSVQVLSPTAAVVLQAGSSTTAPALFWTRLLEKREGRWIITYEHQSWPGCEPPPKPHVPMTLSDSIGDPP